MVEQHGDSLAVIKYHVWAPDDPFYQYNVEENDARAIFYGTYNTPRLWVDGPNDGGYNYENWEGVIRNRWNFLPSADIELSKDYDYQTREVNLTVRITALEHIPPEWDLRILVVLTESNIYWPAPNGVEWHQQVMRDMIPSSSGDTLTIQEGQTRERYYNFIVDEELEDTNCELVVLVQDFGGTKVVLQAAKIRVVGAIMSCEALTPLFCQGKNFYFKVSVENTTSDDLTGNMRFRAHAGLNCKPENILVTIPRSRTYPPGVTTSYYFFKVPSIATPRRYSVSIDGTLNPDGAEVFCCMNTEIVQCEPWKLGDNLYGSVPDTEWGLVETDRLETAIPSLTELHQSYPNPFNASTNINYTLGEAGNVSLKVYDLAGRLVTTLVDSFQEPGEYVVSWKASDASSGVYFCRLETAESSQTRRISLIR